jgi:hypothetical protein
MTGQMPRRTLALGAALALLLGAEAAHGQISWEASRPYDLKGLELLLPRYSGCSNHNKLLPGIGIGGDRMIARDVIWFSPAALCSALNAAYVQPIDR